MQIISDIENFQAPWDHCVATLGDFDGLHRGHRTLIDKTIQSSSQQGRDTILVTYDPSPKKVLQKLKFDSRIYLRDEKIFLLQHFNLRAAVFLPFDLNMARMTGKRFLYDILIKKLKIKEFFLGYDHKFGLNRRGDFHYMQLASRRDSFTVHQTSSVNMDDGTIISSSAIRKLLRSGDIHRANDLLGYPFFVMGQVIPGRQRGRQLGVPTANLNIPPEKIIPGEGVYFCAVLFGGQMLKAVANIGFNPTFANIDLSVEIHILDFSRDIYGETLRVFFFEKIRAEKKFSNVEELKSQIFNDIERARNVSDSVFDLKRLEVPLEQ
ncbi:MAG: bifunctional riboflavin kinase/FAD synthetase [Leptospiraceae bacterium]|nr:bifunctional riboflavin kinase/FAD synthetase [Leptospiraceae bacterium]